MHLDHGIVGGAARADLDQGKTGRMSQPGWTPRDALSRAMAGLRLSAMLLAGVCFTGVGATTVSAQLITPSITWTDKAISYGTALGSAQLNARASAAGTLAYAPPSGTLLAAGVHALRVTFSPSAPARYTSATKTVNLTVNPAKAMVTLSDLAQAFTGTARTVKVATTPAGLPVNVLYNGAAAAPTAVGSYAVTATVTSPNYTGSAKGTLNVKVIQPSVTAVKLLALDGFSAHLELMCAPGVSHFAVMQSPTTVPTPADWQNTGLQSADGKQTVFRTVVALLPKTAGPHTVSAWAVNAALNPPLSTKGKPFSVTVKAPSVTGLVPAQASGDELMTIAGSALGTVTGSVEFDGTAGSAAATVTSWGPTTIVCRVPGSLPAGTYGVTVISADGLASGTKTFRVLPFYLGNWTGEFDGSASGWFLANVGTPGNSGAFRLRLNNRAYACQITSATAGTMTFTGNSRAIDTDTVSYEAASCTGTVTPDSLSVTTTLESGSEFEYLAGRPPAVEPMDGIYFSNPLWAGGWGQRAIGTMFEIRGSGAALRVVSLFNGKASTYAEIIGDILVFGETNVPATTVLHVLSRSPATNAVLRFEGTVYTDDFGDYDCEPLRLSSVAGMPDGTTRWHLTSNIGHTVSLLSMVVKGTSVTISGKVDGTAFKVTGHIFREEESAVIRVLAMSGGGPVRLMAVEISNGSMSGYAVDADGFGYHIDADRQ